MNDTPKNVRQVGDVDVSHKIYVEDYVITYTKELGEELRAAGESDKKAAVLLGRKKITNNDVKTYINGMAVIDSFSIEESNSFTNEIWSSIYEVIKTYYEDEEVVGWLYIGNNPDAAGDKRLLQVHTNNFIGKNLVFMYYNIEEKEEHFFDYMNNAFLKRKGFYIYYQKNDTMHNYMVAMSNQQRNEKDCDDHVVKDVRDILSRRREKYESKKMMKSVYAASMFVAAVALLVGTSVIYNHNNDGENIPVVAVQTPRPAAESEQTPVPVEEIVQTPQPVAESEQTPVPVEEIVQTPQPVAESEQTPVPVEEIIQTPQPAAESVPTQASTATEAKEVISDKTYSFYLVKSGDTLGKISEQIYNSVYYIDEIKKLNGIDNEDAIYAGQKLWLPDR